MAVSLATTDTGLVESSDASLIRFLFAKYDDIPAFMDSAWNIHDGPSSIWTMEMKTGNKTTKMLTIEVRLARRTIIQVRGKLNRLHTDKEKSVIERWAAASKLKLQAGID